MKKSKQIPTSKLLDMTTEYQPVDFPGFEKEPKITSINDLQDLLIFKERRIRSHIGMFSTEAHTISFFNFDGDSEKVLNEIKKKNQSQGIFPKTIGDLTLINFSQCPDCKKIYSWDELNKYYSNPIVEEGITLAESCRKDTRVSCDRCKCHFLPSLILEKNGPHSEFQYLCRSQVIHEIEVYLGGNVLTCIPTNIITTNGHIVSIKQDITLDNIKGDSTLLTNFLQYTPYQQTLMMLSNNYKDLLVYGGNYTCY